MVCLVAQLTELFGQTAVEDNAEDSISLHYGSDHDNDVDMDEEAQVPPQELPEGGYDSMGLNFLA